MTDTLTPTPVRSTEKPPPRSRGPLIALASAAAVLLIGAVFALAALGGGSDPNVANPTEPSPTTTTPTTTTPPVEPRLADVPTWLGQVDPGTYQPSRFEIPFGFTLADGGWERGVDLETKFAICGPDVPGPIGARSACFRASAVAIFLLEPDTVEDTQAYLGTFPGAEITNVAPVTIDGAEGVRFSFTHALIPHSMPEGGFDGLPYWQHESQEIPLGGDESIVSIVDRNGTVVTLVYQGRAVNEPTAFESNLEEGMAIIDSIIWDN